MSVVLLHVIYFLKFVIGDKHEMFLDITNNLMRYAIPFFLIPSGILIAAYTPKNINIWQYWKSKIIRIFIPYAIVVVFVSLVNGWTFGQFLKSLVLGDALVPFYFVAVLFLCYLFFPYIQRFKNSMVLLFASFFISFILTFAHELLHIVFWVPEFTKYSFFFFYGVYMSNYFFQEKIEKKETFFWLILIFLYIAIFLVFPDFYYNLRFFYGVAVFNLAAIYRKEIANISPMIFDTVISYGKNSLWIFLTHFPIVYFIVRIFHSFSINYYAAFIGMGVTSLFICYFFGKGCGFLYNKVLGIFKINS